MRQRSKFGRRLGPLFWLPALIITGCVWYQMDQAVPDRVSIIENKEEIFSFHLPVRTTISSENQEVALSAESNIPADQITISREDSFSMTGARKGSYQVGLKLLGIIKLKDIQVDVVDTRYAAPCGFPAGIYLKSDGVMVIGTGRIMGKDGIETEPAYGILCSGDYIEAFNGTPLHTKEQLIQEVGRSGGKDCVLSLRRKGEPVEVAVTPVEGEDGQYRLGAWVRDDTQGIGTITYIDPNGNFGALGHGISDSDTGNLVESEGGSLYLADILGIEKGVAGKPGLLSGIICYGPQSYMGAIFQNTQEGIFGTMDPKARDAFQKEVLEVACRQKVKQGPAVIRSSVSGELEDYDIEIQKVDYDSNRKNKSMVIKVTDPKLLEQTGGIVQGMSGSPIIQNGKLVGAVTHVFVQDPSRGYGIFAEDMMERQE